MATTTAQRPMGAPSSSASPPTNGLGSGLDASRSHARSLWNGTTEKAPASAKRTTSSATSSSVACPPSARTATSSPSRKNSASSVVAPQDADAQKEILRRSLLSRLLRRRNVRRKSSSGTARKEGVPASHGTKRRPRPATRASTSAVSSANSSASRGAPTRRSAAVGSRDGTTRPANVNHTSEQRAILTNQPS